jgi:hypothetical protein
LEITKDDYLEERLEHQIVWYDSKSSQCQKVYKRLKRTEVILATAIPLISGIASKIEFLPIVVGLLGASIAVIEGFLNIGKYHENWIEYRSICETLKHEKYMFFAKAGVYVGENPFQMLVERIESVISHENVNWAQVNKPKIGGKSDGKEKGIH